MNLPTNEDIEAVSAGWPVVLANLKSLPETGHVLPQAPWLLRRSAPLADTFATHVAIWVSTLYSPNAYGPSPPPRISG